MALGAWMLGVGLLVGWVWWFVRGEVSIFETSLTARLEVEAAPHLLAAPFHGMVASSALVIGREVAAGETLVELDSTNQRLQLAEEEARLESLPVRIAALRAELTALERMKAAEQRAALASMEAARARAKEADAAVTFARSNERRLNEQSRAGGIAQIDALRALSDTQKLVAERDAQAAELRHLEIEAEARGSETQAQVEKLKGAILVLEGEMTTGRAQTARLRSMIEQHSIRAAVAGRIGEVGALTAGAYVAEGQRLASIVPPGELHIVAEFRPDSALGRVRPGQSGAMRLDGFPWAQFGSVAVRVSRVASEIRDNRVRVELEPDFEPGMRALVQHGLPGTIEIAIEKLSPAALTMRAAGLLLTSTGRAADPAGEPRR